MKNKLNFLFAILIFAIIFPISVNKSISQVTDKDGNTYKTVIIGVQEWMAENLSVSTFRNGEAIPEANTDAAWEKAGNDQKPAWCYYNDPINGKKYGKLYNWYAVNDERGLSPKGWHIPSDKELTTLTDYLGGEEIAGTKMKSTSGWESDGNGTNTSGFTGLPGGFRYDVGPFGLICKRSGYWWSTTETSTGDVWFRRLWYSNDNVERLSNNKRWGFSVRCIKD